tara:strand:- start:258 stop:455 length:198 start_codon:yes stop_codon:yes gene_type:complete
MSSELDDEVVAQVVVDALRARGCDVMRVPPETLKAMTREVRRVMSGEAEADVAADGWVETGAIGK